MHCPLLVLVMALLTAGSTDALTTIWTPVETNARRIVPAFMAANPLPVFLKHQLVAASHHSQPRNYPKKHCRIPAICRCRAIKDDLSGFQVESSVNRRDFVAAAFFALALLSKTVSATEPTVTLDVRDIDPELLRALVNVLRARGGMIFLLERLRTNKVTWRISEALPGK